MNFPFTTPISIQPTTLSYVGDKALEEIFFKAEDKVTTVNWFNVTLHCDFFDIKHGSFIPEIQICVASDEIVLMEFLDNKKQSLGRFYYKKNQWIDLSYTIKKEVVTQMPTLIEISLEDALDFLSDYRDSLDF